MNGKFKITDVLGWTVSEVKLREMLIDECKKQGKPFGLIFSDIKWLELPQDGRLRHVRGALLGAIIAAPLLVIFAALFALSPTPCRTRNLSRG